MCPGWVNTEMDLSHPADGSAADTIGPVAIARFAVNDVARAIVVLADSDQGGLVNGQPLAVHGSWHSLRLRKRQPHSAMSILVRLCGSHFWGQHLALQADHGWALWSQRPTSSSSRALNASHAELVSNGFRTWFRFCWQMLPCSLGQALANRIRATPLRSPNG